MGAAQQVGAGLAGVATGVPVSVPAKRMTLGVFGWRRPMCMVEGVGWKRHQFGMGGTKGHQVRQGEVLPIRSMAWETEEIQQGGGILAVFCRCR